MMCVFPAIDSILILILIGRFSHINTGVNADYFLAGDNRNNPVCRKDKLCTA